MPSVRTCSASSRPLLAAATLVAILGGMACGGGGGSSNPVAPPPPPPPTVACTSNSNVQGTVVGFSNSSASFEGTTVDLVGEATTTVDADNQFCFDNVSAGVKRLEFSGSTHLTRRVRITVSPGMINFFDDIDLVESGTFDVAAFDEIYRSFSVEGTVRWNTPPTRVMLDRDSLSSLDQGLDFFESNVRRSYNGFLTNNTNGFFASTPVTVGSIGPLDPEDFSCSDVPVGEIHIVGIDECPMEENFIILGSATHCFDTVGNEVVLGAIFFNPCTTVSTIEHEIIHTLCAGHLESRPNASIMGSPGGAGEIQPLDRRHMRYLYSRPPGTLTPDDAWALTPMDPTSSASGAFLGSPAGDLRLPSGRPDPEAERLLLPSRVSPQPPPGEQGAARRPDH